MAGERSKIERGLHQTTLNDHDRAANCTCRGNGSRMTDPYPWVLALLLSGCVLACGEDNDGKGDGGGAGTSNAGEGGDNGGANDGGGDRCHDGCILTLEAACPVGPKDQATCESDCHDLESGPCGGEYRAFQDCAEGEVVTCDPDRGIPTVVGCERQQSAFISCVQM